MAIPVVFDTPELFVAVVVVVFVAALSQSGWISNRRAADAMVGLHVFVEIAMVERCPE